jgi:hypothetical protein
MMIRLAACIALVFAEASITPSQAQTAAANTKEATALLFQRLDADEDGAVSGTEASAARTALFTRTDRNGDGVIDEIEIDILRDVIVDAAMAAQARLANWARAMDKDGNGQVTKAEFEAGGALFDFIDRDGDGAISRSEFMALRAVIAGARG